MKFFKSILVAVLLLSQLNCSSGSSLGAFLAPRSLAIDSTTDRLFVYESGQLMLVYTASTQQGLGDQPIISSSDDDSTLRALLPESVTQMVAYNVDTTNTRLFFLGQSTQTSTGSSVTNQLTVLNFDGTTFTEDDLSPIVLSDGDSSTTDTDNSFYDMVLDQENGLVYVSDTSAGVVHVISATDGTVAAGPLTVAGSPSGLSLNNDRLYVCNVSSTTAEQVITVFDVSDYSSTTIDVGEPCGQIQVASNDLQTVFLANITDRTRVLIQQVDTSTYDSSTDVSVQSASEIGGDGYLSGDETIAVTVEDSNSGGLTSAVNGLLLYSTGSSVFGYVGQADGTIQFVAIDSEDNSYSSQSLLTSVTLLSESKSFANSSVAYGYMLSESGALLSITLGTADVDVIN